MFMSTPKRAHIGEFAASCWNPSLDDLNIRSCALLKPSIQSGHVFSAAHQDAIKAGPHILLNGSEREEAGLKPRFIWVRVMDSTEDALQLGVFPRWSPAVWTTNSPPRNAQFWGGRECNWQSVVARHWQNDSKWVCDSTMCVTWNPG